MAGAAAVTNDLPSGRKLKRRPRTKLVEREKNEIAAIAAANPALTHQDIADITDVDRSTVTRVLQEYNLDKDHVDSFKAHRADILAGFQAKLLKSVTDDDIKAASLLQRMSALGIAFDKEQAERGVTTGKSAPMVVIAIQQPGGSQPAQIIEVGARQSVDNSPHKAVDNSTSE